MEYSNQQKQTKEFFEKFSQKWSINAKEDFGDFVNIVKIRNRYVEDCCEKFLEPEAKTLDAGCGTGDLVLSLLKKGFDSTGIDFAKSMIEKAKIDAKKSNLPEENFINSSIFDFNPNSTFDLISANGLIEYISEDELFNFIVKSFNLLNKNGILVIEARNRLFNCFSYNRYTNAEIEIGEMNNLLEECNVFTSAKNKDEILKGNFSSKIKKNLQSHESTGDKHVDVKVDIRYQYTPFQLMNILREHGFDIIDLYPIHIHCMNPGAKDKRPDIHTYLSYYLLEQNDMHMQLMPQTSSFMITCKKI